MDTNKAYTAIHNATHVAAERALKSGELDEETTRILEAALQKNIKDGQVMSVLMAIALEAQGKQLERLQRKVDELEAALEKSAA